MSIIPKDKERRYFEYVTVINERARSSEVEEEELFCK